MTENKPASVARGFLFADLRNYSAWVERHGDHAAAVLLGEYRGTVRRAVAEFAGAEIKTEGDSFYVVFGSPSAAVSCGLRILELAGASEGAGGGPIPVGIGVHAGETVSTDEGYVGSVVNIASRVCGQAAAGELLVTDAVRSLTRTYLDVAFLPRGRKRLKGISEPIGLYRVTPVGTVAERSRWRGLTDRWPMAVAVLATTLLVVAIALVGGAIVRETAGGPGSTVSPAPSTATAVPSASSAPSASADAAFPTAAESQLLQLVAADDRDRCQRADPGDNPILGVDRIPGEPTVVHRAQSAASIECDLGGIAKPDRLSLWELTRGGIRVGVANPPAIAIAAHGGLVGAAPGTCREGSPAIEKWMFGDISGTLVCYETDSGDAVLLWMYDGSWLFFRALRDDRDMTALLDWWEDVGRFFAP